MLWIFILFCFQVVRLPPPGPLLVGTVVRPSRYCKQGVALPSGSLKPSEDASRACMHGVQPGRQVKLRTTKGMLASSKK